MQAVSQPVVVHSHIAMFLFRRETWAIFCDPRASDGRRWRDIEIPMPVGVRPGRNGATSSFLRTSGVGCSRCRKRLASGRHHVRIKMGPVKLWICRECGLKDPALEVIARSLKIPTRHVRLGVVCDTRKPRSRRSR